MKNDLIDNLSKEELQQVIKDYEELSKEGTLSDDALLRKVAVDMFGSDSSLPITISGLLAYERFYYKYCEK